MDFDEETHVYKYDNIPYISTTQLINLIYKPFKSREIALKCMHNPNSKYYNMEIKDILREWYLTGLDARIRGSYIHWCIEQYYLNNLTVSRYIPYPQEWLLFKKFEHEWLEKYNWKISNVELIVYDTESYTAGMIDAVYIDNDGKFHLVDWKRSKDISSLHYGNYSHIYPNMPDSKLFRYTIQLNLYRLLFYKTTGNVASTMHIVQLHPSQDNFILHEIETLDVSFLLMK